MGNTKGKRIGIDFGSSFVDVAVMDGRELKRSYSLKKADYSEKILGKIVFDELKLDKSARGAITGVGSKKARSAFGNSFLGKLKKRGFIEILEFAGIANGAKLLSGKEKFVCVNIGTGTPILFIDGKKIEHVAGSGIGGGTLDGLGKMLLEASALEIEKYAKEGNDKLDITILDLIGEKFGKLPVDATASNFGNAPKIENKTKGDIALSLLKMIGETLGAMGALAGKASNCKEIVFTGRVAENAIVQKYIKGSAELFGGKAFFPKNAALCTAIGAAIANQKK
ncbi:hypothetical protein HY989_02540 [Candidatus Micrarchaeota archaeon]|nr:hypothetical protein [Candidatus Micrarchaeota archaeon]